MLHPACRLGLTVVIMGWLFVPGATAQNKPLLVQDDAKLFSEKAIDEANTIIAKIKDKSGRDLVIETKEKGPADLETAGKVPVERAALLASKSGLDGVYLLITKEPRKFYVEPIG